MTTPADIEWEAPAIEPTRDPVLARYVRQTVGVIPPVVPYFYPCPWIVRAMVAFDTPRLGLAHIELGTAQLIELVVSQDNSCRYCYAATRAMLKMLGFTEQRIQAVEGDLLGAELDPKLRCALDFARHVSRASPPVSREDVARLLDAGHSREALQELAFVAGVTVFYNRLATLPAVPTDMAERLDRSRFLRAMLPLLVWFRGKRNRKAPPPRVARTHGPYGYLTEALAGSSVGAVLAGVLDDAWESPVLPRRTKALILAVVGRGLGCSLSEEEARRLLIAEDVDSRIVEETLAHLASDGLSPVERAVVPFARETLWYRPVEIQRRARVLRDQLSREQFLECVGLASLANALCRMSVVSLLR